MCTKSRNVLVWKGSIELVESESLCLQDYLTVNHMMRVLSRGSLNSGSLGAVTPSFPGEPVPVTDCPLSEQPFPRVQMGMGKISLVHNCWEGHQTFSQ